MTFSGKANYYFRDSQAAFNEAIERGMMTDESAGDWMYMYSDASCDYFKHIDTRRYWQIDRFAAVTQEPQK
jgi:hypothetical protein